jgi:hypothetical protein
MSHKHIHQQKVDNKAYSKELAQLVQNHSNDANIYNEASQDERVDLANPGRMDSDNVVEMVDNRYSYYIYKF